ncbi:MAG: hypothetical protein U0792_04560 [Gemmataceae bacterium]
MKPARVRADFRLQEGGILPADFTTDLTDSLIRRRAIGQVGALHRTGEAWSV